LLIVSDLAIRSKTNPINNNTGENLPISVAIIWLLIVVPILAPNTIPIACLKVNICELTNTIVIIITAEEESNKVVTIIPTNKLLNELDVNLFIQPLAFSPIAAFSVSDKLVTANKNKTKPAIIDRSTSVIFYKKQ